MKDHFQCRPDGRSSGGTLRPLACEMSCLQRADGSALWKAGSTSVLAAVYGPVAPRQSSKEDSSKAIITVLCKGTGTGSGGGQNTATETSKNSANRESSSSSFSNNEWLEESSSSSSFLVDMLMACVNIESYKRSVIQIVLSIIQADGSVLACALHAAVAALLDAGIEMNCLPVATTCLLLHPTSHDSDIGGDDDDNNETPASSLPLFLDPVEDEETIPNSSTITFVNDSEHPDKILGCQTKIMGGHVGGKSTRSNDGTTTVTNTNKQLQQGGGGIELETFIMSIEAASRASPAVVAFWRLAVEQKVTRESQTLWSS